MGITFTKAFMTSDGLTFATIEEAQKEELLNVFHNDQVNAGVDGIQTAAASLIDTMIRNSDRIIDILSTTPRSRPKGRKVNGATRKKKETKTAELPLLKEAK